MRSILFPRMLGALLVGGVALAVLLLDSAPRAESQAPVGAPGNAFGVFEQAAESQDDISSWGIPEIPQIGLETDAARVVVTSPNRTVAAVPAAKAPCLVTRTAQSGIGISCATAANEATATVGYNGAIGLVPDSVKSVMFTMVDGSTQAQDVVDNIWQSPVEAETATFDLEGETQKVDLMPRSSMPKSATVSPDGVVMGGDAPPGFGG